MPTITFDIPATASVALNTIAQGGFCRIGADAHVRSSGAGTTISVTNLSTGLTTPLPSATLVESLTLDTAAFIVTPA